LSSPEEIMPIRFAVTALVFAASTATALADIPDGRGGRTSLQASPAPHRAESAACCRRVSTLKAIPPLSPAERKQIGEVAWLSRHGVVTYSSECARHRVTATRIFSSPAELKALGHLASKQTAEAEPRCGAGC
jgi:hypothetical protein